MIDQNPLRKGLRVHKVADPCAIIIFGASGDLTKRKLIPALYSLARQNLLGTGSVIVGASRTPMSDDEFRQSMRDAITEFSETELEKSEWENFASTMFYNATDVNDPASLRRLNEILQKADQDHGTGGNRLFYLSVPPGSYSGVIKALGSAGMNRPAQASWVRIIIEKPFGSDAKTARELNRQLHDVFQEDQIYRIDHYLGKETVQNIAVLRFANGILEPLWNRNYIDHVQITAAESIGVENRGGYYEHAGALRDMIQNHMLQLLTLIAMEPPVALEADAVRDEKIKVIRAMRPLNSDIEKIAVRGQYTEGIVGGKKVPGYRLEESVNKQSMTETFAAIQFQIDNWRWAGVPFYVRSGKRLPKRVSEVAVQFKRVPHPLFREDSSGRLDPNWLILRIQPEEGIALKIGAKLPGQTVQIRPVSMDFEYGSSFGKKLPEAYERLLLDAMIGDATLYARGDMVELSWDLVMPVLDHWKNAKEIPMYAAGSWGPDEADQLLEDDGRKWRRP